MSIVWSIGAVLEEPSRPKFHEFMMDLIKGEDVMDIYKIEMLYPFSARPIPAKLLECSTIYDLCFENHK